MKILKTIFCLVCLSSTLQAAPSLLGTSSEKTLIVNNRILANVNGKPISVIDLMKKMDMLFYQQFPEYVTSAEARYQFYQMNWKRALQEAIDKELVMADASENKMPLTSGDVRQELESLFGPNVIANLDKIDMNYEEAAETIRGDLLLRRMLYYRVNMKAMRKVTPKSIRDTYQSFVEQEKKPAEWTYKVISIRAPEESIGATVSSEAYRILKENPVLGELNTHLDKIGAEAKVTVSDDFVQTEGEVAPTFLTILKNMQVGQISEPIKQTSRADNSSVFRLLYLIAKNEESVPSFAEAEKKIKEFLIDKAIGEETKTYLTRLRKYYAVQESHLIQLADDTYCPFSLQ